MGFFGILRYMNTFKKITYFLAIAITPLVLIFIVAETAIHDDAWYKQQFIENGSYDELGKERVLAQKNNLFEYFSGANKLEEDFYTGREIGHLVDVKILYQYLNLTTVIIFALWVVLLALNFKKLPQLFFQSGIFSLVIYGVVGIILVFFFESAFLFFHQISFDNTLWQLNPVTEKLIVIFPPTLFAALLIKIVLLASGIAIFISLIAVRFIHSRRQRFLV